jgi:acylphosphatase
MAGLVPAIHVFDLGAKFVDARHKAGHDDSNDVVEFKMSGKAEDRRTVTVRIEGRVQGVYYRAWTDQNARALGLDGTVRNRNDGSVEAVFSGPADKVAEMLRRCAIGPPDAEVTDVIVTDEGGAPPSGFRVIGTNWR